MTTVESTSTTSAPPPPRRVREPPCTSSITPPGSACRVLPLFSPPGCHCYDAYLNCFQHRPEVRGKLREAARRHEAHRRAIHHHDDDALHDAHRIASVPRGPLAGAGGVPPMSADAIATPLGAAASRRPPGCRCGLQAGQLFASRHDVPQPPLPLSKCELHEVLQSLPPRWQNYPWQLCFDTARDGFSLATLYRCMEGVEAQQSRAKTVAFGLFFVHTRDDAFVHHHHHTGPGAYPSNTAATPTDACTPTTGGYASGASLCSTPATAGNSKSFSMAHQSSSMRYEAARGTLPFSVVGCFTPEVPTLTHHAANVYFGSAESSVFRLDQLGQWAQRGAWMQQAFEGPGGGAAGGRTPESSLSKGGVPPSSPGAGSDGESRGNVFLHSPHGGKGTVLQGYALLAGQDSQARVPVPLPTHTTIEHPNSIIDGKMNGNAVNTSRISEAEAASSPPTSQPTSPSRMNSGSVLRYSLRAAAVMGVVPRAPLLTKYGWSGRPDNRKFIVCNPHFLAFGAGKSGAALYVDGALEFGTSSNWCETYNAPCLFGLRRTQTPSLSPAHSPAGNTAAAAAAGFPSTLPHCEFAIRRVVWFAITEDKKSFRVMNSADGGADAAAVPDGDALRCRCGRVGCGGDVEVAGTSGLSSPVGLPYAHQCDLLPFTEQRF